jgi:hypothetical protein
MRLILAILAFYHAWRARGHSRAYRRHMERRASIMGRAGR